MPPPESSTARPGCRLRCVRFLRRLLLLGVLLAVGVVAWLQTFGVPRPVVEALIRQAARQGVTLDIGPVDLRLDQGITARDVVWYSPRDPLYPMVRAGHARIGISWTALLTGRLDSAVLDRIELSDASLRHQTGMGAGRREMKIENLQARLSLVSDGFVLDDLSARILHFDTVIRGRVVDRSGGGGGKVDLVNAVETVQKAVAEFQTVYRLMDQVDYTSPPGLMLDFNVDTARPADSTIRLSVTIDTPFTVHGQRFNSALVIGRYQGGRLTVDTARVDAPAGLFELTGTYDRAADRLNARIHSALHPDQLLALSPAGLREELAGLRLSFSGGFQTDIEVRDVPLAEAHRRFSARVSLQGARCRDVLAETASFDLVRDGDQIRLTNIMGRMGEGEDAGPFSGTFLVNIANRDFQLDFQSGFDPWVIMPFIGPETEAILKGLEFTGPPPFFRGRFEGGRREDGSMRTAFQGEAESAAMILRGTAFDRVRAKLDLNSSHTHIDGIEGLQNARHIRGSYRNNRETGIAALDLETTLNPVDIGRIIGPEIERLMASYPIEGASRITARGDIDIREMKANRIVGSIDATLIDIYGVRAENLAGWWTLTGDMATFPHLDASVYGGKATGMFQLWPLRADTNRAFFASATFENIDLIRHARPGHDPIAGILTGNLMIDGSLGPDAVGGIKGGGRVELRKGALFQVKLFGGLSKYLSKLFPGFGYSSQTDLTATVDIADGRVKSPDVRLFGNVVSIFMRGNMTFDRQLSFDVQVKPLSEGVFSKALQIISWPVTKLFEFRLSGSLEDPKWRPNNLPKEMFLQF